MDTFIGRTVNDYLIQEQIGKGCIGSVYKAFRAQIDDVRAIKFVPFEEVEKKENWQLEITKVNQLHSIPSVVHYHDHSIVELEGKKFLFIMWEYVKGKSLRELIDNKQLTMQILEEVINQSLSVFYACGKLEIQHADFHAGNILIEDPNPLHIEENTRPVRITDFGYGTFSPAKGVPAMDDYAGLAKVIQECLESFDFHTLEQGDRHKYHVLKYEFPKLLHETNPIEGDYVRNAKELRTQLQRLFEQKENIQEDHKNLGDFLSAELIGERYDEWNALFVPKFIAIDELLDRNICVLTGLRGCGKTMIFRRLSFDLQKKLGPSNIPGENTFIGFYLNARLLAEAFPWLPDSKQHDARKQVINYFNAKWCIEILEWLKEQTSEDNSSSVAWLCDYFAGYLPNTIFTGSTSGGIIKCIIDGCTEELSKSKLGARYLPDNQWGFSEYDFLSDFLTEIFIHHGFGAGKSVFFFLDDYSTPMINRTMQKILNPIVFRRTANIYFKVSTESTESFVPEGLNGKTLENGSDYKLIDLGSELFKSSQDNKTSEIIIEILEKRINRSSIFAGKKVSLERLLGNQKRSNNDLAIRIRESDGQVQYCGAEVFCNLWSSDIRELIKILSEMISAVDTEQLINSLNEESQISLISSKTQDAVLRNAGGHFLNLLAITTSPTKGAGATDKSYGAHLIEIVSAFQEMAYYELKTKDSKNGDNTTVKQARKIELKSISDEWRDKAEDYYKGLLRYGVFIQDYRAKSVGGSAAKRLYLRSLLIPYCRITFSKRDSIMLDWDEFNNFLLAPKQFVDSYKAKKANPKKANLITDQIPIDEF